MPNLRTRKRKSSIWWSPRYNGNLQASGFNQVWHPNVIIAVKDSLSNKTHDCTLLPSPVIHLIASRATNQHKMTCGSSVLSSTNTAMVLARAKQKYVSYRSYILSSQCFLFKTNSLLLIFPSVNKSISDIPKKKSKSFIPRLRYQLCGSTITINSSLHIQWVFFRPSATTNFL